MRELCKFGLFTLMVQGGITSTHEQTIHHHIHIGYYQWKSFLVQGVEAVTNGTYWAFGIIILGYLFYLIFVRQIVANLSDTKNPFKRLETALEYPDVSADYANSTTSFFTHDYEATTPFTVPYVPSFTLSAEDAKLMRPSLRQVWSFAREPKRGPSALEILKAEIQESRRLRHQLESNLEKILQENEGLATDRSDWADHLLQFKVNRTTLAERLTASKNRLTASSVVDHKILEHRLAASKTEIQELQLQIDELKSEKQSAIEMVSKILFRPDSPGHRLMLGQHGYHPSGNYRNFADDDFRNSHPGAGAPKSSIYLGSTSCVNFTISNITEPPPENCSGQFCRSSNVPENGMSPDPPRNIDPDGVIGPNHTWRPHPNLLRKNSDGPEICVSPDPLRNIHPGPACIPDCSNKYRVNLKVAESGISLDPLLNDAACRPDPVGSCSSAEAAWIWNHQTADLHRNNLIPENNPDSYRSVENINNVTVNSSGNSIEAGGADTARKQLLSIVDPSMSFGVESSALGSSFCAEFCCSESVVTHCSSSEEPDRPTGEGSVQVDVRETKADTQLENHPREQEGNDPSSEVIGDGVPAERPRTFSGPVTGSPLFQQFLTSYVKNATPE